MGKQGYRGTASSWLGKQQGSRRRMFHLLRRHMIPSEQEFCIWPCSGRTTIPSYPIHSIPSHPVPSRPVPSHPFHPVPSIPSHSTGWVQSLEGSDRNGRSELLLRVPWQMLWMLIFGHTVKAPCLLTAREAGDIKAGGQEKVMKCVAQCRGDSPCRAGTGPAVSARWEEVSSGWVPAV